MSAQREELHHLVDDPPEKTVPPCSPTPALSRHTRCPPALATPLVRHGQGRTSDVSERVDEILRAELGQI